jgi:hypothetical protein
VIRYSAEGTNSVSHHFHEMAEYLPLVDLCHIARSGSDAALACRSQVRRNQPSTVYAPSMTHNDRMRV